MLAVQPMLVIRHIVGHESATGRTMAISMVKK